MAAAAGHHPAGLVDAGDLLVQVVQLADLMVHHCQNEICEPAVQHQDSSAEIPPRWRETGVPASDEQFSRWYGWLRCNRERCGEVRDLLTV